MLSYLLLGEVLRAELKLLVLGFHGFAQFLKNLRTHSQYKGATVRINTCAALGKGRKRSLGVLNQITAQIQEGADLN